MSTPTLPSATRFSYHPYLGPSNIKYGASLETRMLCPKRRPLLLLTRNLNRQGAVAAVAEPVGTIPSAKADAETDNEEVAGVAVEPEEEEVVVPQSEVEKIDSSSVKEELFYEWFCWAN